MVIFLLKKILYIKLVLYMYFVLILFIIYMKKKVWIISKNCDNDNFIDRFFIGDIVSYKEVNVWFMYRGL